MRLFKYLVQYRFCDIGEMIRNDRLVPKVSTGNLRGKTVVLSGATSGIGLATARLFAAQGAQLVCLNRDPVKSEALARELQQSYDCQIRTIMVDFASLEQIRNCVGELRALGTPIDVLIHNTGIHLTKKIYSADDIEMVFQVNHLGSFLINYLLKEQLKAENRARIIYVNSEGHRFSLAGVHCQDLDWRWHVYTGLKSYGAAKTAQLLTMMQFRTFFSGSAVSINAMHPGNVSTKIGENNGKIYRAMKRTLVQPSAKDPVISAEALLYLASAPEMAGVSGQFFNLTAGERPAPHARDPEAVREIWNKSLELCGLS